MAPEVQAGRKWRVGFHPSALAREHSKMRPPESDLSLEVEFAPEREERGGAETVRGIECVD